ncbi:deoxyribonuclease IV [Thermodesulfobacteriota bacterium]
MMLKLGAHMSIAGGLHLAFDRIRKVKGTALQIFSKNQRQWFAPPLNQEDIDSFTAAWDEWGEYPIGVHGSYLVNLATNKPEATNRMIAAFADEIERTSQLKIPFLITHPGAHLGDGIEAGLQRLVNNLDQSISKAGTSETVTVLLETTAGQGTSLGTSFEELSYVLAQSRYSDRLGICLDTCHIFAAGYDIRTQKTFEKTVAEFDRIIGLDRLKFLHLNDSKKDLGSRVDRHEHIGKGTIGHKAFSFFLNDHRLNHLPMTIETPKEKDLQEDIVNLTLLRSMLT